MLDYLIRNGKVVDGTGSGPADLHVGIRGDRIAYLGPQEAPAREVIDAGGMIVSPGFIDTHGHSEFTLLADMRSIPRTGSSVADRRIMSQTRTGPRGVGCATRPD